MSRRNDLVVARLRMIAERWRTELGGSVSGSHRPAANQVGAPERAETPERGAVRSGPAVGAGGAAGIAAEGGAADTAAEGGAAGHAGAGGAAFETAGDPWSAVADDRSFDWPAGRTPFRMWVTLLGVLAVVVIAVVGVALARSWPSPTAQSALPRSSAPTEPTSVAPGSVSFTESADPGSSSVPATLTVHVAGPVRHPGLVVLPAGSRVADALAAAGGLRRGGDLGATNLARILTDGERVEIGAATDAATGSSGGEPAAAATIVDLNTATAEQLDSLPGVGPVTAAKILAWRVEHGRFTVVDELAEVPGIGPKTLEELRPHVRV